MFNICIGLEVFAANYRCAANNQHDLDLRAHCKNNRENN